MVEFEIGTDLPTFTSNLDHYEDLKLLRSQETRFIQQILKKIQRLQAIKKMIQDSSKLKKKDKEHLEKLVDKLIQKTLDVV